MDLGLSGRVAWVLGGSSGLGRAAAESLAREGVSVAISARGRSSLDSAARDIEAASRAPCLPVPLDVSNFAAIPDAHRRVVDELGTVDVLVANSGGPPAGALASVEDEQLEQSVSLLVRSAWYLTRAVLPGMKANRRGVLLYLTSSSTKEVIPGLLLSNMMRAAVVGMAKTLSKEVAPDGVRVLCVAPGRIDTPRIESLNENRARREDISPEDVRRASQQEIPLGRYGRPAEVGDVVAFLASERAAYMTGTSVVVDGGLLNGVLT